MVVVVERFVRTTQKQIPNIANHQIHNHQLLFKVQRHKNNSNSNNRNIILQCIQSRREQWVYALIMRKTYWVLRRLPSLFLQMYLICHCKYRYHLFCSRQEISNKHVMYTELCALFRSVQNTELRLLQRLKQLRSFVGQFFLCYWILHPNNNTTSPPVSSMYIAKKI